MSKSLGNFYTLRDLKEMQWSGREIRWVLAGAHYRKKLNFTFDALTQARETLNRFSAVFERMRQIETAGDGSEIAPQIAAGLEKFGAAMADDLNTAEAIAQLFDLSREANRLADSGILSQKGAQQVLETFRQFDRILGCLDVDKVPEKEEIPTEITALAEARSAARKAKNFAESDRLRDEISAKGYLIEDAPGGCWRLKKK